MMGRSFDQLTNRQPVLHRLPFFPIPVVTIPTGILDRILSIVAAVADAKFPHREPSR